MNTLYVTDRSLGYITAFVVAVHACLMIWCGWVSLQHPVKPKMAQRLVVKTISLKEKPPVIRNVPKPQQPAPARAAQPTPKPEPKPVAQSEPVPEPAPEPLPIEKPKPKPKPAAKPKPKAATAAAKPKPKPKAKPETKPAPVPVAKTTPKPKPIPAAKVDPFPEKKRELLAKAQESIAKIQGTSDKINAGKLSQKTELQIPQLKTDEMADWSPSEIGYRDELAGHLKLMLRLPEYGEVKIKLTVGSTGQVLKVVVVSAESAINRKYIEKALPSLSLPPFGRNFDGQKEETFSITLSNAL